MMQSSRLRSIADVHLRLRGDPELYTLQLEGGASSLDAGWRRNGPAEADTLSLDVPSHFLPADLRVLEGMAIEHWLTEAMGGAGRGSDAGYFTGQIDTASRKRDDGSHVVTLSCRDWTAVPQSTKLTEAQLERFPFASPVPLVAVVEALIGLMDIAEPWRVVVLEPDLATILVQPPAVKAATPKRGSAPKTQAHASGPHLGQILPAGQTTAWSAVNDVCIKHGVTPEVRNDPSGRRVVVLMSTHNIQTTTALRPFERNGQTVRRLVEGEDCIVSPEQATFTTGDSLPDFYELASINPRTGASVSARYPPADKLSDSRRNGVFQTVDGVADPAVLLEMARAAFEARAHNQYRLQVEVKVPWSRGGGPADADLLDLAYGAGMVLERRPEPARSSLVQNIDPKIAKAIRRAEDRLGVTSTLFQVSDVEHKWGSASYSCMITLRQFLGLGRFDATGLVPPGATDVRGISERFA